MRGSCIALVLTGCVGGANLGTEHDDASLDALDAAPQTVDSGAGTPGDDAETASTGLDASGDACSGDCSSARDAGVPDAASAPLLCLVNGTFASDPSTLPSLPTTFEAAPWLACGTATPNFPQVVDSSVSLLPLRATDGDSFLSLAHNEQVAQALCAALPGLSARSFTLDVAALLGTGSNSVTDMVGAALEIYGGQAADCSQSELLWTSSTLTASWQSVCVTIMPRQGTDNLTLRAAATGPLPYPGRVLVDHIQSVAVCP